MIEIEYRGHRLSNAVSAIVKYYPKFSNGSDLINDVKEKSESLSLMGQLYCAFRCAADVEARNKSFEDLLNEIDFNDLMNPKSEFYKIINKLLIGEKSSSQKND